MIFKTRLCWAAMAGLALSLTSCATLTRGTHQKWTVTSNPAGATVRTSHNYSCTTPCTLNLPRGSGFTVTVSKPGYKTASAVVKSVNANEGALVGNMLTGGIGLLVDAGNSSMMDLSPDRLTVTLEKD